MKKILIAAISLIATCATPALSQQLQAPSGQWRNIGTDKNGESIYVDPVIYRKGAIITAWTRIHGRYKMYPTQVALNRIDCQNLKLTRLITGYGKPGNTLSLDRKQYNIKLKPGTVLYKTADSICAIALNIR